MGAFGILEDVTAEVMRQRRHAVGRAGQAARSAQPPQSEMRVRWKPRAERDGVGPRWPW
jgi:hypothetical protein